MAIYEKSKAKAIISERSKIKKIVSESISDMAAIVGAAGLLPTLAAVRDGSYLLNTPIFLVGQGELAGWNRQFVEFILGPVGQQIVEQYHARIR